MFGSASGSSGKGRLRPGWSIYFELLIRPRCLLQAMCFIAAFAGSVSAGWARDVYSWSQNLAVAPFTDSRQQGETALAADSQGRVWLSFIDANYQNKNGGWIASPRKLRLFVSSNGGLRFTTQQDLTPGEDQGGDQALAADLAGRVYATIVTWAPSANLYPGRRIVLKRLDISQNNDTCLPQDNKTTADLSNVHIGVNGVVHVVGVDINLLRDGPPRPGENLLDKLQLMYARSLDGGKTCVNQQRLLEGPAQHPHVVDTAFNLLIIDFRGYYASEDHGVSFSKRVLRNFGEKAAHSAVSLDRRTVYVVGHSTADGLQIHVTSDGGKTWRVARVDDAPSATAWRYPAVHVDDKNRVHVVWMDDRAGFGALYHAYSDDAGAHFSQSTRVSDKPFPFPAKAPPPPPATQDGTWVGDYISLTTVGDRVVVAWSDQREGTPKSVVRTSVGVVPPVAPVQPPTRFNSPNQAMPNINIPTIPSTMSLTGKWVARWKCDSGAEGTDSFNLKLNSDGAISGEYLGPWGGTLNGRISGNRVTFVREYTVIVSAMREVWTGTNSETGHRIVGSLTNQIHGTCTFQANRM